MCGQVNRHAREDNCVGGRVEDRLLLWLSFLKLFSSLIPVAELSEIVPRPKFRNTLDFRFLFAYSAGGRGTERVARRFH